MQSLERQLQINLAITLCLVMLAIWLIGLSLQPSLELRLQHLQAYQWLEPNAIPLPKRRFQWLFPMLALVGIGLTLGIQSLVIRRTFKRLDRIQAELQALNQGKIQQLNSHVPCEFAPLIADFNQLLLHMQERLERSRHSLGNLAHALKTPLNLLTQYLDQMPHSPQILPAKQQLERIRTLMERELKRARLAGLGNSVQRFNPQLELPVLSHVLQQVYATKTLAIQYEFSANLPCFGDREDMLELLGNLLDNACKWARQQVQCSLTAEHNQIYMSISDDGSAPSPSALQTLTERGTRLDENIEGYGLGLAICKDIIKLYNGSLQFSASPTLGGLEIKVQLPLS